MQIYPHLCIHANKNVGVDFLTFLHIMCVVISKYYGAFQRHWVYKHVTVTNKQRMLEFKFSSY